MSEEAMQLLCDYSLPDNVRELENIIEHAFVLCNGWFIEPRHLPLALRQSASKSPGPVPAGTTLADWERVHILEALRRNDGSRRAAADKLGIDPRYTV